MKGSIRATIRAIIRIYYRGLNHYLSYFGGVLPSNHIFNGPQKNPTPIVKAPIFLLSGLGFRVLLLSALQSFVVFLRGFRVLLGPRDDPFRV